MIPARCLAFLLIASAPVAAAGDVDLSLAASWLVPALDARYMHSFTPSVEFEPPSSGTAGHTLDLAGENGYGLRGTIGIELSRRLGLELLVARARHDAAGPSTAYAYRFDYTARQPPSNEPRTFTRESEQPWPDAFARLRQLVLGLSLHARFPIGRSATLGLLAGPTLHRVSGEMESLAWTHFYFGGHAVLFEDTFRLGADLPGAWKPGLGLGGELDVRLGGRWSLVVDARYFLAGEAEVQPKLAIVRNSNEVIRSMSLEEIASQLPLAPLRLDPSFLAASAGLRLRF
jgi:hypothetical protein